jgi:hypothetical protein
VDYRSVMAVTDEGSHTFGAEMQAPAMGNDLQEMVSNLSMAGSGSAEAPAMSQLAQGFDMPAIIQTADNAPFAGAELTMPALQALAVSAALSGGNEPQAGVVAQVLADALAGGGDGPNIDGLLASLGGDGGGLSIANVLATQHSAGVPAWDMGAFGGFTAVHQAFTMETLVLHQDAVVQQA